jgi:hypothetical protein
MRDSRWGFEMRDRDEGFVMRDKGFEMRDS